MGADIKLARLARQRFTLGAGRHQSDDLPQLKRLQSKALSERRRLFVTAPGLHGRSLLTGECFALLAPHMGSDDTLSNGNLRAFLEKRISLASLCDTIPIVIIVIANMVNLFGRAFRGYIPNACGALRPIQSIRTDQGVRGLLRVTLAPPLATHLLMPDFADLCCGIFLCCCSRNRMGERFGNVS
jgi:hypothetical protein